MAYLLYIVELLQTLSYAGQSDVPCTYYIVFNKLFKNKKHDIFVLPRLKGKRITVTVRDLNQAQTELVMLQALFEE